MSFIKGNGINFRREFDIIKKNKSSLLQPIFEAISNSLESINIGKNRGYEVNQQEIKIYIYLRRSVLQEETGETDFQKIIIHDTGIGLEDVEFRRFVDLRDDTKGYSNRGTGRVQYLHYFDKTKVTSIFRDDNSTTGFKIRQLLLSKSESYLQKNAYIDLVKDEDITSNSSYTEVHFKDFLEEKDEKYFISLTMSELKNEIIRRYLGLFCENRQQLPQITMRNMINGTEFEKEAIIESDIPLPAKEVDLNISYSILNDNRIEKISKEEPFKLKSFILPRNEVEINSIRLVSKGELARKIKLDNLLETDQIDGNRFLFLLSGDYLDKKDSDSRGQINIPSKFDFIKRNKNTFESEVEVLLEDIEQITNDTILSLHQEIVEKVKGRDQEIEELRKMFLLNPKTLKSLRKKIHVGDSDDDILKKVYQEEMKPIAEKDANIKKQIKELDALDPSSSEYQNMLANQADEFVKIIPLQNRSSLAQYVARRKLVLDLFDKVLKKEIEKLSKGERIDEKLLHNIIFQQSSAIPENSDLWLIEEEFIYFKGYSEIQLDKIEIDGIKLFKDSFTEEVERYLNSNSEKRLTKRPDVLLFPQVGKCILIEFKAPDVNVSVHLNQVNFYSNLIRNYTDDRFQITTFYGYLIGENIEDKDVRGYVGTFKHSPHFNYWYRPSEIVSGFDGRSDGSIYTEVIKYSTLLERARLRNKIFIEKLTNGNI